MAFTCSILGCFRRGLVVVFLASGLAACATAPTDPIERQLYEEANDPIQPLNEAIFDFNLAVYKNVLKPVSQAYEFILPELVRDGVRNFLRNLESPVVIVNHVLQGEPERAGDELGRFMVNSFGGVLGVFDVASEAGIPNEPEDFGQTLAVWGVDEGPYLVLPFLGSSSGRDLAGFVVDMAFDPFFWAGMNSEETVIENNGLIRAGLGAVDETSRNYRQIDTLEETSLDFYATVRSLYRQQRQNLILNGAEPDTDLSDVGFDDDYLSDDFLNDDGSSPQADASVSE